MKSLLLNTFDIEGGAAIATYRLHQGLRAIGVDSSLLVQQKKSDDFNVIGPRTRWQNALASARPYLDGLMVKKYKNRQKQLFSPAIVPDQLASRVQKIDPDIVHIFWVAAGFMRLETLAAFKKPIVWTMHDMWPLTGGCHYDGECGKYQHSCGACPLLGSTHESDLSRQVWSRKKEAWGGLDITIVATSQWLAECARSSSLFKESRIEVIPNGLDEGRYKPIDKKTARHAYNLPVEKKLILFSSFGAVTDKRKGFQHLLPALQKIAQSGDDGMELVILGASEPKVPIDFGMQAHYINHLHDDVSQILLYSAADVLVLPSEQENLSNTVLEALFCGTPVVAFNIGGMPDMIEHKCNGYLAEPFDVADLAEGIKWVIDEPNRYDLLSRHARNNSVERYSLKKVASQYLELYRDLAK